jgi:aspartate kinase
MMKVLKFGGTSLANAQRFESVLEICMNEKPTFIVVSAVAGVTNKLVEIVELLKADNQKEVRYLVDEITDIFIDIISESFLDFDFVEKSQLVLARYIIELKKCIKSKIIIENQILSCGELITSELLNLYFRYKNYSVELVAAEKIILLNKLGEPDEKLISSQIEKIIKGKSESIFLTQGFLCSDYLGNICTLGRGGSDLTASLIGSAINASEIQIWTDISGLQNNDPRYVNETFPIPELSYNEAAELAYFGAKILHPVCVLPAKNEDIPVRLKNTLKPFEKGTLINSNTKQKGIKSIAAKDGITIIKIKSARMLMSHGFLKRIFEIFDQFSTSVDVITTSEVAVSLTIDNLKNIDLIIDQLNTLGETEIIRNQIIICIVGEGLVTDSKSIRKILEAISDIPVQMVSLGGSKINVTVVVDSIYKNIILNELHERLMRISYVA